MSKFSFAAKGEKKTKKQLSPAQQKVKTVFGWVVSVLSVIIIILALAVSILTITRTAEEDSGGKGIANIFGYAFMPVQSDSMSGTFEEDDLIIAKVYEGDGSDIKVGQVITFKSSRYINGANYVYYNTHRVVEVVGSQNGYRFYTKGDNEESRDTNFVTTDIIRATWGTPAEMTADDTFNVTEETKGSNWGQVGKVINWLQNDSTNYILVVVLPLILLFVVYAFILIRTLVINKIAKVREAAANVVPLTVEGLSEEDKRRLAEEYLASLSAAQPAPAPVADTGTAPAAHSSDSPFEPEATVEGAKNDKEGGKD